MAIFFSFKMVRTPYKPPLKKPSPTIESNWAFHFCGFEMGIPKSPWLSISILNLSLGGFGGISMLGNPHMFPWDPRVHAEVRTSGVRGPGLGARSRILGKCSVWVPISWTKLTMCFANHLRGNGCWGFLAMGPVSPKVKSPLVKPPCSMAKDLPIDGATYNPPFFHGG